MLTLWSGTLRPPSRCTPWQGPGEGLPVPPAPAHHPVPLPRTISASTQVQGGDINLYENMRCHGVPLVTISRGRVVYENGVFMCAEGTGKFCPLRSFPDIAYKKLVQREKVRGQWWLCRGRARAVPWLCQSGAVTMLEPCGTGLRYAGCWRGQGGSGCGGPSSARGWSVPGRCHAVLQHVTRAQCALCRGQGSVCDTEPSPGVCV